MAAYGIESSPSRKKMEECPTDYFVKTRDVDEFEAVCRVEEHSTK